jgi:endonuclease YncB( thermonuclease family)
MLRILLLALLPTAYAGTPDRNAPIPKEGRVAKVYDGDTFTLESGDKIRLRWVNTPELRPKEAYGEDAKEWAVRAILGSTVRLVVAPEGRDGYGRIIAGVRIGEMDLSTSLLEQGLGHVFIIPPENHDMAPLLAAQKKARELRRGIWGTPEYQGDLHITSFHANGRGDDYKDPNVEYMRICNVSSEEIDLSDWTIATRSGTRYPIPMVFVPAGHTVMVHSGKGAEQPDPGKQIVVYLGSDTPIWDDDYDEVHLVAPDGQVVQRRPSKAR